MRELAIAASLLLGAHFPPPPRRGSPRRGVAYLVLPSVYVVAAVRGVTSKPRAAAFLRKLRSAWACLFAAYSSIPCWTYSRPYLSMRYTRRASLWTVAVQAPLPPMRPLIRR